MKNKEIKKSATHLVLCRYKKDAGPSSSSSQRSPDAAHLFFFYFFCFWFLT